MTLSTVVNALAVAAAIITVLAALAAWQELAYRRAKPLILSLLDTGTDARIGCTGMDLVRRSNGKLGRGTVYVWLSRMEDEGLIESEPWLLDGSEEGAPRRRIYRLKEAP